MVFVIKAERLREWLEDYRVFEPFPHPLNPDIVVTGLIPGNFFPSSPHYYILSMHVLCSI
jgi:hypothetical protein